MLNLPTKPRITAEVTRGDYAITINLRYRRNWKKLSLRDRELVLEQCAEQLEQYASQMRKESHEVLDIYVSEKYGSQELAT